MLFGHLLILSESLPLSMKNNSSIHFKPKKVSNLKNVEMMLQGHSGEYGNAAKLVGEMSKSVMQLISIHF